MCRTALAALGREGALSGFDTGRYVMRFAVWGSGPPLVIVHGLSDAVRGFAMVMHRLAAHFTCIGYELPNGLDDGAKLGAYHHRDYTSDLFALLDHLKLERVALLGSSFGTTVALRAMAERPERFTKCVLKGGFAYRPLKWYERLGARQGRYWSGRL
ncbi:MAG TPA: alpha/beta hydrolase, partial [Gemmata sp.]